MTRSEEWSRSAKNTLYSKGQPFRWRAGYTEALITVGLAPEFDDANNVFDYYSFPSSVTEEMGSWSFKELVISALCFLLEIIILDNEKRYNVFLTKYNWKKIARLILNSAISADVLQFIEDVGLKKYSSEEIIISGSQKAIENIYNFDKLKVHEVGLRNLLVFLNNDLATAELLVNEAFEMESVANIITLLSSFEGGLGNRLILTSILKSYQNHEDQDFPSGNFYFPKGNQEKMEILIKKSFDEIYKSQIIGSEDFNIFDMFESSENFKARTPQIVFSSLCQDLFKDLRDDKMSNSLNLFELFEEYLISSKDRIFIVKAISLESLKDFSKINRKFILAKKTQIEAILEKRKSIFSKYYKNLELHNIVSSILLFCLTVIIVIAGVKLNNENREKKVYQTPYGFVNAPFASITGQTFHYSPPRETRKAPIPPVSQVQVVSKQNSASSKTASQKVSFNAPKGNTLSKSRSAPALLKMGAQQNIQSALISQQISFVEEALDNNSTYREATDISVNTVSIQTVNGLETEANMLNSVGTYQDLATAQRNFAGSVKPTSMSAQTIAADKEHVIIKPIRKGLTIPDAQGGCFIFLRGHHVKHTNVMNYKLPDTCGYTKKDGLFEYQDSIEVTYIDQLNKMYETNPQPPYLLPDNVKAVEQLEQYGIGSDDVAVAVTKAFAVDRKTIMGMDIPKEALLPWSHVNMINLTQADAYKDFAEKLHPGQGLSGLRGDPKGASERIEGALLNGLEVGDHYLIINKILKPGSAESYIAETSYTRHMLEARSAIHAVRSAGGTVDSQLEAAYFNTNRPLITLDEAENIALMNHNLKDPKQGCLSVFGGYYKKR